MLMDCKIIIIFANDFSLKDNSPLNDVHDINN